MHEIRKPIPEVALKLDLEKPKQQAPKTTALMVNPKKSEFDSNE